MQSFKRTISYILLVTIVGAQAFFLSIPTPKAHAFTVTDVITNIETLFTTLGTYAGNAIEYSTNYKELVLDGIAYSIAKLILRQLTSSVVEWINSGFKGNPAFVTNPAAFFGGLADETIGNLISKNGDLAFLCSPFSIDVRIAIALKYKSFRKKITCTLSDVIRNATNAAQGATINGFTAGDFSQGGWPAFASLSTEPQNNIYGAYLAADSEVSARIGNLQLMKRDELNQGKGFLSYTTCKPNPVAGDAGFMGIR